MKDLFQVALDVQNFIEKQGWKFCFIGGLALQRWGENRLTNDVDLTVLAGFGSEEEYVDIFLTNFRGRRDDVKKFALTYRVLLLQSQNNVGIDIVIPKSPFVFHLFALDYLTNH